MVKSVKPSADDANRLERMIYKLKGEKFRLTPQRLTVLKILAVDQTHPSVAQVYNE